MVKTSHHIHEKHQDIHTINAYGITAICLGVIGCLLFLSVVTYKCYRRRRSRLAQSRLSTAIKKGLKESSGVKKNIPPLGTPIKHKATSPLGHTRQDTSPGERKLSPTYSTHSEKDPGSKQRSPDQTYIENEKDNKPEMIHEKEESMREKQPDEKQRSLGNMAFSIAYDLQKMALLVTVVNVKDLPTRDPSLGGCDPYIKLQLLPEKRHKCKTRVLRKTLNPQYDETFTFYGINPNQIPDITLHFVVLSFDRFSRDDIIGEVIHPLNEFDISKNEMNLCKEICPRHLTLKTQGRGEILVSLCYQPAANRLTVVVLKARNLPKMDITGLSDPYIKVYLLYNNQRIAKKKTHVKKRTLNPVYNESFLFDVPYNEGLANISLEFLVLDWDRMTKNEVVGRLEIGSKASSQEIHHWNEVMNCPRKQIAEWHKLTE